MGRTGLQSFESVPSGALVGFIKPEFIETFLVKHQSALTAIAFKSKVPLAAPCKPAGLKRNAAIVLGNMGDTAARTALLTAAAHSDAMVADAAQWALDRI